MSAQYEFAYNLRPVWDQLLAILEQIDVVCKKHNICYYGAYGTVLGAVRHHGFIPWDDDLDIMMTRPNFDRFCAIANQELPANLELISKASVPKYPFDFVKVQEIRPEVIHRIESACGRKAPHGYYVDIFPIDGVPESYFEDLWRRVRLSLLQFKYNKLVGNSKNGFRSAIRNMLCVLFGWVVPSVSNGSDYMRAVSKVFSEKPMESRKFWGRQKTRSMRCPEKFKLAASTFGTPQIVKFENRTIPIPANEKEYLRCHYGDYMQLPPLEKRQVPYHSVLAECHWKYGTRSII